MTLNASISESQDDVDLTVLSVDRQWDQLAPRFQSPVLIVSTVVGRGMFTLGEAIRERLGRHAIVEHIAIEHYLPSAAVAEDLGRYKFIANRLPALLYLIYTLPIFYYRKYLREIVWKADLAALRHEIETVNPHTVICVSHRPGFWISALQRQRKSDFQVWGLLGEYGNTLGWKYIFWKQIDGFLSPLARTELSYAFPPALTFVHLALPARRAYYGLAGTSGDPRRVLVVCGYWGQGPIVEIVKALLTSDPDVRVIVVCGENETAARIVGRTFLPNRVAVYGVVDSLETLMRECGSVVTKPGISTLLEAQAAGRKIFLVKGMPVAEDNNARYALQHFGAEWFNTGSFQRWLSSTDEHQRRASAEPGSRLGPVTTARLDRERAYWNEAYRTDGDDHRKYVWSKRVEGLSYIGRYFGRLTRTLENKRILSLGGGIDRLAIELAKAGNRVMSVDIAPQAVAATIALARQERVLDRLAVLAASAEAVELTDESFDVVIFKRALHHMDAVRAIRRARDLLVKGGVLLAEEPVCLPAWLRYFHRRFPFHPDAPRTSDERELDAADLNLIRELFADVRLSYFDCTVRESVAHVLDRLKLQVLLRPLGRIDYLVLNRLFPVLRQLSTYVIIQAVKG